MRRELRARLGRIAAERDDMGNTDVPITASDRIDLVARRTTQVRCAAAVMLVSRRSARRWRGCARGSSRRPRRSPRRNGGQAARAFRPIATASPPSSRSWAEEFEAHFDSPRFRRKTPGCGNLERSCGPSPALGKPYLDAAPDGHGRLTALEMLDTAAVEPRRRRAIRHHSSAKPRRTCASRRAGPRDRAPRNRPPTGSPPGPKHRAASATAAAGDCA